ncbi:rhomboid family intramembrane serine protease [Oceanospirillum maris]|uniref:rhomboid family intramembrane serine protease n=1 Tax=Oceanospirillum maris TaxID=64977 RepID=UPI0003F9C54F|nr:rhomboid family intramembrane serine protease [Oceanospirillum maris]
MIKVLELPHNKDLSELSHELWARKIGHQIRQSKDSQEIWLANPKDYPALLVMVEEWQRGELAYTVDSEPPSFDGIKNGLTDALRWPLTFVLLLISALITALISFDSQSHILSALSIVPFHQVPQGLSYLPLEQALKAGDIWRLLTPTFLHFGLLHLIFNGLWVWELGRMIEKRQSTIQLAVLFLISAIGANLTQYMMGDILFGGLSGVVYALLGYCWFWDRLAHPPIFYIRKPVFILLLVWLVFCLVGGSSLLGFGNVANAAHIAGLVSGSLWAFILVKFKGEGKRASKSV